MSACECDDPTPIVPRIPAGLDALPRQLRSFPDVREALLRGLGNKPALRSWHARSERDLGLMWLEMWAYVSDVLAFYDERIANESYLRTAHRRTSLRRLNELLGHIQNPGVAGEVRLALLADGRKAVSVPAGTGFRTDAFDGEAPQVYESFEKISIHSLRNQWRIGPIRKGFVPQATPKQETDPAAAAGLSQRRTSFLVFDPPTFGLLKDEIVYVRIQKPGVATADRVSRLKASTTFEAHDGNNYVEAELFHSIEFPASTPASAVKVLKPTLTATVTQNEVAEPGVFDRGSPPEARSLFTDGSPPTTTVVLDAIYRQIRPGEPIVIARTPAQGVAPPPLVLRVIEAREIRVIVPTVAAAVDTVQVGNAPPQSPVAPTARIQRVRAPVVIQNVINSPPASPITSPVSGIVDVTFDTKPPPVTTTVTMIRVAPFSTVRPQELTFHFGFVDSATLTTVPSPIITAEDLSSGNAFPVSGTVERPPELPSGSMTQEFLLQDADELGALINGTLTFHTSGAASLVVHRPALDQFQILPPVLKAPLRLYGNVVKTTRGEGVFDEVLGNGDPRIPNQQFELRRKPLTYVDAPEDSRGFKSTLRISVNGIEWREVRSFFGMGPEDEVFIVRHDDDNNAIITFGDGVRGARLPSGIENVIANYRFGAGEKAPPAGGIQQIARPVDNLGDVISPVAATLGKDPEKEESLRTNAPRELLALGRAVSVPDFEALAQKETGVIRASAEFVWLEREQRAGVRVRYIGSASGSDIWKWLHNQSDPDLVIKVGQATPIVTELSMTIGVDPRFETTAVATAVKALLIDETRGLLSPRNASIGGQFWSSKLYAAALSVQGVVEVQAATLLLRDFPEFDVTSPVTASPVTTSPVALLRRDLRLTDVVCIPPEHFLDFAEGQRVAINGTDPIGNVVGVRRRTGET